MEALAAVSAALLTVYDMLKAVDRSMEIGGIRLLEKRVRSGAWVRDVDEAAGLVVRGKRAWTVHVLDAQPTRWRERVAWPCGGSGWSIEERGATCSSSVRRAWPTCRWWPWCRP